MKVKKTPGPVGIPDMALKAAILEYPDMFRSVLQKCLDLEEVNFPNIWKIQELALLPKSVGDPTSYRPICLLDLP